MFVLDSMSKIGRQVIEHIFLKHLSYFQTICSNFRLIFKLYREYTSAIAAQIYKMKPEKKII